MVSALMLDDTVSGKSGYSVSVVIWGCVPRGNQPHFTEGTARTR